MDDRETALVSAILYMFVPSKLLFFPGLNTVTPVFVLACAWLWVRLLGQRSVADQTSFMTRLDPGGGYR